MELSLKIELTDRRNSGESRALWIFFFIHFLYYSFFNGKFGGSRKGSRKESRKGSRRGVQKGGSTFCLHPYLSVKPRMLMKNVDFSNTQRLKVSK